MGREVPIMGTEIPTIGTEIPIIGIKVPIMQLRCHERRKRTIDGDKRLCYFATRVVLT